MIKKNYIVQKNQIGLSCELKIAGYFENDPEHGINRNGIQENILLYCVGGKGTVDQTGNKINVNNGDLVIIKENTPHSYYANKKDPWAIYWVHFTGELSGFFKSYDDLTATGMLHIGFQTSIVRNFDEILNKLSKNFSKFSVSCANAHFILILSEILNCTISKDVNYELIIEYMRTNISSSVSLNQLSELVNLTKYHLSRQFKLYTGYSLLVYFKHLKIAAACELLNNTNKSIADISDELNFCSPYYFSEQFKAITGYRPLRYRKLIKNLS